MDLRYLYNGQSSTILHLQKKHSYVKNYDFLVLLAITWV